MLSPAIERRNPTGRLGSIRGPTERGSERQRTGYRGRRDTTETSGTHSGGPATSDPTGLIGIAAMLAGGYQGAPAPVGATCAGTGPQAGCESPGSSSPPLPGIADARHSSNLTIAAFVAGLEPATASPARQRALTALASSMRRSVVPPAASRLGSKPDSGRTAASPLAVQRPRPEVAMGTLRSEGPSGRRRVIRRRSRRTQHPDHHAGDRADRGALVLARQGDAPPSSDCRRLPPGAPRLTPPATVWSPHRQFGSSRDEAGRSPASVRIPGQMRSIGYTSGVYVRRGNDGQKLRG